MFAYTVALLRLHSICGIITVIMMAITSNTFYGSLRQSCIDVGLVSHIWNLAIEPTKPSVHVESKVPGRNSFPPLQWGQRDSNLMSNLEGAQGVWGTIPNRHLSELRVVILIYTFLLNMSPIMSCVSSSRFRATLSAIHCSLARRCALCQKLCRTPIITYPTPILYILISVSSITFS